LQNSTPVELGGEYACCPSYLSNGSIVYYMGWIGQDHDMHIMIADSSQGAGALSGRILHSFAPTNVGKAANLESMPLEMSVSDDGLQAFIIWSRDSAYVLQWLSSGELTNIVKVESELLYGTICPDGTKIAYTTINEKVVWQASEGGVEYTIENGHYPTWDKTSTKLGYLNGTVYTVYDFPTKASKKYPFKSVGTNLSLSPQANEVAYRTFSDGASGISVGEL
jgi:hypothetical protein